MWLYNALMYIREALLFTSMTIHRNINEKLIYSKLNFTRHKIKTTKIPKIYYPLCWGY